jgi:23S rRNA pseudouridine2605 synthase
VISIGRLDINSEGLLLLTNDGELSRSLELPSSGWVRRYRARAFGHTTQEKLDTLKDGITVEGVRYGAIEAKLDKAAGEREGGRNVWITVTLSEGKNREVRRVLEAIGLKVNRLLRLAYGPFSLGVLAPGEVEEVGPRVIRELLADHIPETNMPTGTAVQFKGGGALRARRTEAEIAGGGRRAGKPRPGQESGELKGERQPKKPGWARAKPKPPGGLRTPKKPGAVKAVKKHWAETSKVARPAGAAKPAGFARPSGPAKAAGPRGPRPTAGPNRPRNGGPGKRR